MKFTSQKQLLIKIHFSKYQFHQDDFESLNDEIKGIIIEEGYFTAESYRLLIKTKFSILGSIKEISRQEP